MSAKVKRLTKGKMVVSRNTIFFPTPEDPEGVKHVTQKFLEAEAGVNLLVTAIARADIPIDLLDLPKASELLKIHAEHNGLASYPGPSVIAAVVDSIRGCREHLDQQKAAFIKNQQVLLPPGLRLVRPEPVES